MVAEARPKVAVVGHFGGAEKFLDGQTVKTKTLCDELSLAGVKGIVRVDTWLNKHDKPRLLAETLKAIRECDVFILLLSRGGLSVFLPIFRAVKALSGKRVYLDVIGGNTAELVRGKPYLGRCMASFDSVWPETRRAQEELRRVGVENTAVIPNFKRLASAAGAPEKELGFRFCTFSRVTREKGIAEAVDAVKLYREDAGADDVYLDVWGPIEKGFSTEFEGLCSEHSDFVTYKGCVPYSESMAALRGEDALLFPTRWEGEGFPGTLVDAFAAGLPVVASDWNSNSEVVTQRKTGLIYPSVEFPTLYDAVAWCASHRGEIRAMGKACLKEAQLYTPEKWVPVILKETGLDSALAGDDESRRV